MAHDLLYHFSFLFFLGLEIYGTLPEFMSRKQIELSRAFKILPLLTKKLCNSSVHIVVMVYELWRDSSINDYAIISMFAVSLATI
jgi:hypothetical protein